MKTHISIRQVLFAGIFAVALLSSPFKVLAQEQEQEQANSAAPERRGQIEGAQAARFDLEVVGGLLADGPVKTTWKVASIPNLVEFLQKREPEVNFILRDGASDSALIEVKLHSVDIMTVLNVLPELTGHEIVVSSINGLTARGIRGGGFGGGGGGFVTGGGGGGAPVSNLPLGRGSIVVLSRTMRDNNPFQLTSPRQVAVFNINGYLGTLAERGKKDEKDVMEASQQIQQLVLTTFKTLVDNAQQTPDFEFHRGTGLFIVVGSAKAIDVATRIIDALPGQPNNSNRVLMPPPRNPVPPTSVPAATTNQ